MGRQISTFRRIFLPRGLLHRLLGRPRKGMSQIDKGLEWIVFYDRPSLCPSFFIQRYNRIDRTSTPCISPPFASVSRVSVYPRKHKTSVLATTEQNCSISLTSLERTNNSLRTIRQKRFPTLYGFVFIFIGLVLIKCLQTRIHETGSEGHLHYSFEFENSNDRYSNMGI